MMARAEVSPESRKRMSLSAKRGWDDPDIRRKRVEAMNASGAAMSLAAKRTWADPDVRQRRVEGIRTSWADPESRQRQLVAIAAGWAAKVRAPEIPSWVPSSLAGEYIEHALSYDEFDAAKHIRSLLRDAK